MLPLPHKDHIVIFFSSGLPSIRRNQNEIVKVSTELLTNCRGQVNKNLCALYTYCCCCHFHCVICSGVQKYRILSVHGGKETSGGGGGWCCAFLLTIMISRQKEWSKICYYFHYQHQYHHRATTAEGTQGTVSIFFTFPLLFRSCCSPPVSLTFPTTAFLLEF